MSDQPLARIYVSGPIKGQLRAEADFNHAADQLEAAGFDVVNPFDVAPSCAEGDEVNGWRAPSCVDTTTDAHYDHLLRGDLAAMLACDGVALLDGWQASRGARLEQSTAVLTGIPVMPLAEWLA